MDVHRVVVPDLASKSLAVAEGFCSDVLVLRPAAGDGRMIQSSDFPENPSNLAVHAKVESRRVEHRERIPITASGPPQAQGETPFW